MAVAERGPGDFEVVIKFNGGLNTRASAPDIGDTESTDGQNFDLDLENGEYRNRKPFDLVATTPNAGSIDGFAQLQKRDGTISTLIQSGTNVYEWDGVTTFTLVGTVNAGTRMRGHLSSNWSLTDVVLIADLALQTRVKQWDGTTFDDVIFTGLVPGSTLRAAYIFVDRERAHYGNIFENSGSFPHMVIGSTISDYTTVSVLNRPSSAIGTGDPWFMLTPDLKPINGLVGAFGIIAVSSNGGNMYEITGTDSTNFNIVSLFSGSAASGDEAIFYVGNDIIFGRQGRIETLSGTLKFGDVETDDVSRKIADQIEDLGDWTIVFNGRTQRVYFFSAGQNDLWVLHKPLLDEMRRLQATPRSSNGLSPWSKWKTDHALDFKPTTVMPISDPVNGLETMFMGDATGNIYRLEGSGAGDGSTTDVVTSKTSKIFSVPLNASVFDVEGYVQYLKGDAAVLSITILWSGTTTPAQVITIALDSISDASHFNNGNIANTQTYFNSGTYFSSPTRGRFVRKIFAPAGQAKTFQVKVEVSGKTNVKVSQVGLRFQAA